MKKALQLIEKLLNIFLFLLFSVIFFAVLLQVVSRFIPDFFVMWPEDVIRLSFLWMIALAAPLAIKYDELPKVDMIFNFVSLRTKLVLELINIILVTAFCFIAGYTALPMLQVGRRAMSVALQLPLYYFFLTIPVCFFLGFAAGILKSYDRLLDVITPQRYIDRKQAEEDEIKKFVKVVESSLEADGVSLSGKGMGD